MPSLSNLKTDHTHGIGLPVPGVQLCDPQQTQRGGTNHPKTLPSSQRDPVPSSCPQTTDPVVALWLCCSGYFTGKRENALASSCHWACSLTSPTPRHGRDQYYFPLLWPWVKWPRFVRPFTLRWSGGERRSVPRACSLALPLSASRLPPPAPSTLRCWNNPGGLAPLCPKCLNFFRCFSEFFLSSPG